MSYVCGVGKGGCGDRGKRRGWGVSICVMVIAAWIGACPATIAQLSCRLSANTVDAGSRIEIRFDHTFDVDNPDDPREISVAGVFISPCGQTWRMPGFLYQDYRRDDQNLIPNGEPEWCIRFTPREVGTWEAKVVAMVGRRTFRGAAGKFEVREAESRGFLRVSKRNPRALEFENGEPFIGIGCNLVTWTVLTKPARTWHVDRVTPYMRKLADAGGNLGRLHLAVPKMPIECSAGTGAGYEGAGHYHQPTCWEADQIINEAERLGITIILCNSCGNTLLCEQIPADWKQYRYLLKEHGGPLNDMSQFYRHPEVKRLFEQKARYCVARWGASPAVGMWEFLNEVPLQDENAPETIRFCHDYARYWRDLDPYERPITVCPDQYSHARRWDRFFDCDAIDFVAYHTYSADDLDRGIHAWNDEIRQRTGKPIIISEFGSLNNIRTRLGDIFTDPQLDPKGIHLHNGIWATGMSGSVAALPWFIGGYIDELDLYHVYTGFQRYASDWRLNEGPWRPIEVRVDNSGFGDQRWGTMQLPMRLGWLRSEADTIVVHRDGRIEGAPLVNVWLYGPTPHRAMRRPPTFDVDYPVPGRFVVHVKGIEGKSGRPAPLVIELDGREKSRRVFMLGEGQGKRADYIAQYDIWSVSYDERVAIDVPPGRHRVRVDYQGDGQVRLDCYELERYADAGYVVRALAMDDEIRLWIRNGRNTHSNHFRGDPPTLAPPTTLEVPVKRRGRYEVQWWDTVKGEPTRCEELDSNGRRLIVPFSGTLTDEAVVIRLLRSSVSGE